MLPLFSTAETLHMVLENYFCTFEKMEKTKGVGSLVEIVELSDVSHLKFKLGIE